MTGTNCDLFTHNQSQSYLNHLEYTNLEVLHSQLGQCLSNRVPGNPMVQQNTFRGTATNSEINT